MAKIAKKVVDKNGVLFQFADGSDLSCDLSELPEEMVRTLAVHGLSQKVGDSYSGAESISDAVGVAGSTWNNLTQNLWSVQVSRGGKVVEAMVRATGEEYDTCLEMWNALDEAAKKDMRKHPQVKAAIAEIDLERARAALKAKPQGGDDLGELFKNLPASLKNQAE